MAASAALRRGPTSSTGEVALSTSGRSFRARLATWSWAVLIALPAIACLFVYDFCDGWLSVLGVVGLFAYVLGLIVVGLFYQRNAWRDLEGELGAGESESARPESDSTADK